VELLRVPAVMVSRDFKMLLSRHFVDQRRVGVNTVMDLRVA
jgi:hypothetical protein